MKADAIIILAGDRAGNRIVKGAELVREGFAPVVIISNGWALYGHTESDLATSFAIQRGYSPGIFIQTHWIAHSTIEEAHAAIGMLRSQHAHKVIVVTATWHTARAAAIYRRNAPEITFYMVGSYDPAWHDGEWWKDRQGRKVFFLEAIKTIADFLGL